MAGDGGTPSAVALAQQLQSAGQALAREEMMAALVRDIGAIVGTINEIDGVTRAVGNEHGEMKVDTE